MKGERLREKEWKMEGNSRRKEGKNDYIKLRI